MEYPVDRDRNRQRHAGAMVPVLPNERERKVCECLHLFNQLRAFKLDSVEILEWKDTIFRKVPDLDIAKLEFAIDGMMDEQIPYDKDKGIQNIFRALERVTETPTGLKILKAGIF